MARPVLGREGWLRLWAEGLTCAEAARRAGTTRSGAWRAAQRYGFEWHFDTVRPQRHDVSDLTPHQQESYQLARRKGFPIGEARRIAKTDRR